MFEVENRPEKLTVYVRMSGAVRLEEAQASVEALKAATDSYGRRSHVYLADLRGLLPLPPEVAAMLGEAIAYSRQRGTIVCIHLSDSAIVRLQATRLVREINPDDSVTIDVVSLEEAELALEDARRQIVSGAEAGIVQRIASGRSRAGAMSAI